MLLKCCIQYASKFGILSSGHGTGKGQLLFQSQRKCVWKCQLHSRVWLFPTPWPIVHLCPRNSPEKSTGVGSPSLLQGIFPTQGLNLALLQGRQILYCLSHQGSLRKCIHQLCLGGMEGSGVWTLRGLLWYPRPEIIVIWIGLTAVDYVRLEEIRCRWMCLRKCSMEEGWDSDMCRQSLNEWVSNSLPTGAWQLSLSWEQLY